MLDESLPTLYFCSWYELKSHHLTPQFCICHSGLDAVNEQSFDVLYRVPYLPGRAINCLVRLREII